MNCIAPTAFIGRGTEKRMIFTAMDTRTVESRTTVHRWTRAQYERMIEAGVFDEDDRVQLIEGEIVTMSPQGSRHAVGIRLVHQALRAAYADDYLVDVQLPLALGASSEPEPDVAVVEGDPRDYIGTHPRTALLVVEVAESSAAFDRTRKQALYAQHGIEVFWLLDLEVDHLEVYRRPAGRQYEEKTTLHRGDEVTPPRCEKALAVSALLP